MIVTIESVDVPGMSTIGYGRGRDQDGNVIHFAGDHRPMRDIAHGLSLGEVIEVELEDWQILAMVPAMEEP